MVSYLPAGKSGLVLLVEAVEENTPWTELNRQGKLLRTIAGEVKTIVTGQRLHSTPDPAESWGHIASGQGEGGSGWKTTKRNSGLGMGVGEGCLLNWLGRNLAELSSAAKEKAW